MLPLLVPSTAAGQSQPYVYVEGPIAGGETSGRWDVAIVLSSPSSQPVTVQYATADGTAKAGADYIPATGTLVFAPGEWVKRFELKFVDDQIPEPVEHLFIQLSAAQNATIRPEDAEEQAFILDNDGPVPSVAFSSADFFVGEAGSKVTIEVRLSEKASFPVTVDYATSDGSAKVADRDYVSAAGTLSFSPGETSRTFTVLVLDDKTLEGNEGVALAISNPSGASLGAPASATLTITDDETPPPPPIVTVVAGPAEPNPVPSGDPSAAPLTASASPATLVGYTGPTWAWSATGAPGLTIDHPDPASPAATLRATIPVPGSYDITVTATATWSDGLGGVVSAAGSASITQVVVGVKKIQEASGPTIPLPGGPPGGTIWVDIMETLYVPSGSTVGFRAVPNPQSATFPKGQPTWRVTTGAAGAGQTFTTTFVRQPLDQPQVQTVTATCGNSSVTVKVVAFEIVAIATPQDSFAGRDQDYYGVCESIDLSFATIPPGITSDQIRGLYWEIREGGGELAVVGFDGSGLAIYTCENVADRVALVLRIGSYGQKTVRKEVVPPELVFVEQAPGTGIWHDPLDRGAVNVGFLGHFYTQCSKKVSFEGIECREGECRSTAGGYWAQHHNRLHAATGDDDPFGGPRWYTQGPLGPKGQGKRIKRPSVLCGLVSIGSYQHIPKLSCTNPAPHVQ